MITDTENNPYYELIDRILHREETLSVSSFKEFMKSPRHFIRYKMKEKVQTEAMLKGSVVHCLILEPDEFESRYIVVEKPDRRTKAGQAEWAYIQEETAHTGKEVVFQDMYDQALRLKEYCYKNPSIRYVLDGMHTTEKHVTWELGGYKWRGYVDGIGDGFYVDLKGMRDATPRKAKWTIRDMGYLFQGYLYGLAPECKGKDFYIVALEDMPNGSVINIDRKTLDAQRDEIDYYINFFKKCVFENAWNQGYDYFSKDGIFNYSMI